MEMDGVDAVGSAHLFEAGASGVGKDDNDFIGARVNKAHALQGLSPLGRVDGHTECIYPNARTRRTMTYNCIQRWYCPVGNIERGIKRTAFSPGAPCIG